MKAITFSLCLFLAIQTAAQTKPVDGFPTEMELVIQHMMKYTLAVANQMPEDKYAFRPVNNDTVRTFAEQMKHIVVAINFQAETVLERKAFDPRKTVQLFEAYESTPMSKAEIATAMTQAFEKLLARLARMTDEEYDQKFKLPFSGSDPKSMRVLTMFVRDHITHHRAQAIVYLRMNGIEPPFYQPF